MYVTVKGEINSVDGSALVHEHIQIDLRECKSPDVYLGEEDIEDIVSDLQSTKENHRLGMIVDVSVHDSGRNPMVLREVSRQTGLPVISCTGFYWAPYDPWVINSSVEDLIAFLLKELTEGANGTDIRCGAIKIGTLDQELSKVDEKVFQAAGKVSQMTGAPIITHSTKTKHVFWQIDSLLEAGADPSNLLVGHLDASSDSALPIEVAKRGVFLGIDQIGFTNKKPDSERARIVRDLIEADLGNHIILSSDIASKHCLMRNGGSSYSTVFEKFVPECLKVGINKESIRQMLYENPVQLLRWKTT